MFIIITFLLLSIFPFATSASNEYSIDGDSLVVNGKVYDNVLNQGANSSFSLTKAFGSEALFYSSTNGFERYFVFDKYQHDKITCIYNSSRIISNGVVNRNAVCGLEIPITNAIDESSAIIDSVSQIEYNYELERDSDGSVIPFDELKILKYKNKNFELYIKYDGIYDYIDGSSSVLIKNLKSNISREFNDFYFVYYKLEDGYNLKSTFVIDSDNTIKEKIDIK